MWRFANLLFSALLVLSVATRVIDLTGSPAMALAVFVCYLAGLNDGAYSNDNAGP